MALITPAQFRTHFPQLVGTNEDVRLTELIAEADALMALFMGWPRTVLGFYTCELTDYVSYPTPRIDNPNVLDLPHGAAQQLEEVFIDPDWLSDLAGSYGAATSVSLTKVLLVRATGEVWLSTSATPYGAWSTVPRANKIEYSAGLTAVPMPFDIVALCASAVRHLLDQPRFGSAAAVTQQGTTITRADAEAYLPASVRSALAPFVWWGSRVG